MNNELTHNRFDLIRDQLLKLIYKMFYEEAIKHQGSALGIKQNKLYIGICIIVESNWVMVDGWRRQET